MAEPFVAAAADSAVKGGVSFINKHSSYVFCFKTYVQNLEGSLNDLETNRQSVVRRLNEGRNKNEEPDDVVKNWLEKVVKTVGEGKDLSATIIKSKNNCFFCVVQGSDEDAKRGSTEGGAADEDGIDKPIISSKAPTAGFVLNPWTRWRISRKAERITTVLLELGKEKISFDRYTHPSDPRSLVTGSSSEDLDPKYCSLESRRAILQNINKALISEDVSIVGVWGPSGVGKSTLLDEVVKHVKEKKFGYQFDEVAKATVSRTPDIGRIQAELADWLGLSEKLGEISSLNQKAEALKKRLTDEKVKERLSDKQGLKETDEKGLKERLTDKRRLKETDEKGLKERLTSKKGLKETNDKKEILIILDDLARKIDLREIGIPFIDGGNIKLLITSRFKEVLENDMTSKPNFELQPLEEKEALELFKSTSNYDDKEEETLKLIKGMLTNECAGLPLSINGLAVRLRPLPSSEWKDTLKKLKHSTDLGVKNFIDEMLESSYDVLNFDELKYLFLLCGQIGTQVISVKKLVIYGMGLGIFKGIDMIQEARDRVNILIKKLKSCCLLKDEKPGYIKIHDRISDVALGIASKAHHSLVMRSGDQLMKAFIKEDLQRCKSISLFNPHNIRELPKGFGCPELNMFSLVCAEDHATKFKLPSAIFQDMKKLKVLELFRVILMPLPQSIKLLHQLQTLCLDSCDIDDLTFLGELKQLQVLVIRKSKMVQLPKEIAELTDLRVLDLRTCDGLEIIEQGILGRLTRLEELLLPKSFKQWDKGGDRQPINASLTELSNMLCLNALNINIPDLTALPNNLPLANLMSYSLCSVDEWEMLDNVVQFDEERTLILTLNSANSRVIFEDFVQNASQKAQEIHLSGWVGFEKSVGALFEKVCTRLKCIEVQNCHTIEYIIDLDQDTQFLKLESLSLYNLANLKSIFLGGSLKAPFHNLKVITISNCESLKQLFSFSLMENLSHVLEELKVRGCGMIEEIVTIPVQREVLELKALRKLTLDNLPKLLSFYSNQNEVIEEIDDNSTSQLEFLDGRLVSFPNLESLTLSNLKGLRKLAHNQHPRSLQSLKFLALSYCNSLVVAIESKLLQVLTNLDVLSILDSVSIEAVFELEEESSTNEVIKRDPISLMPNVLKLHYLHHLKKIWNGTPKNISFVLNLRELEIYECPSLEYVFSLSMAKSLKNLSSLQIDDCSVMKGVFVEEMSSHEYHSFDLPCLNELTIRYCSKMKSFISSENTSENVPIEESFFNSKVLLPNLEKLDIQQIGEFESIWGSNISDQSFHKLTSLELFECDSVTVVFPSIMVRRLQQLKEINIGCCSAVEVLFESGEENLMMPKLRALVLEDLPKLTHITTSNSIPNKNVFGFPSLTDLKIEDCHSLINLFDNATAVTLSKLENLDVRSCTNMKAVFSGNGGDENVGWKMMAFNKLFSLNLEGLNDLTHFCTGYSKLYFPVLKTLQINECANFKGFIPKLANAPGQKDSDSTIGSKVDNDEDGVSSPLFDDKVMLPNLQDLLIGGNELKEIWHDKLPSGSFCKLQVLEVVGCGRISVVIPSFMLHNLHNLEKLSVNRCDNVEVVIQLEGHTLRGINLGRSTVCKLKSLEVEGCPRLINLFTAATAKILKRLEELTITDCDNMEAIVSEGIVDHNGGPNKTVFPQLSVLRLGNLRKLTSFCTEKHTTEWPSLKQIEIRDCGAIEAFVADSEEHVKPLFLVEKELWGSNKEGTGLHNNKSGAFCNLKSILVSRCQCLKVVFQVEDCSEESTSAEYVCFKKLQKIELSSCDGLEHVFPTSVARCLHQLNTVQIKWCKRIKEIVVPKGDYNKVDEQSACHPIFFFPKLTSLTLEKMPQLKSFYGGSHSTKWQLLEHLQVIGCPKVKILSPEQEESNNLRLKGKANNKIDNEIPSFKAINIRMDMLQLPDEIIGNPTTLTLERIKDEASDDSDEIISDSDDIIIDSDDIIGNPTTLTLERIKDEASAVQAFPWRLLLERPHNLRRLEIRDCDFEEIFPWSADTVDGHGQGNKMVPSPSRSETGVILIENIAHLVLRQLPKLKHMWKEGSALADILDIVEKLEIKSCRLLTGILFPSSFSASFSNLKVLTIYDCHELRHVLTYSTARCLVRLTLLEVVHCDNLEKIVTHDDYVDSSGDQNGRAKDKDNAYYADITFHRLRKLRLEWLPRLTSFSSSSCNLDFPCLATVEFPRMKKKNIFSEGIARAPLLSKEKRRKLGIQTSVE